MTKRVLVWTVLMVMAGVLPASAQARVEISGFAGWVFSDGVSGDPTLGADGQFYDQVDPKDSANFGFSFGVLAGDNAEVGFIYARQGSTLVISGTSEREIGDMEVTTYHGYFGYNWGDPDAVVRPFFFGGSRGDELRRGHRHDLQPDAHDRQRDAVLDDVGGGSENLSRAERRRANWGTLDADLHQVRCRRVVVRSLVWLLSGWQRAVLQSVPIQRRRHVQVLMGFGGQLR